jgi:hypothetical protein
MSVLIGCIDCAEAFEAERPDVVLETGDGRLVDGYRCPACGEMNVVGDAVYRHYISRRNLAGLIHPEQGREHRR